MRTIIALLLGGIGMQCGGLAEPFRVLLLSGQNNHAWTETTPKLQQILTQTGRFTVEITEHPEQLTAQALEGFDVILGNWNTFVDPADAKAVRVWPAATREAYLNFVRQGKGHVVVHAGSSSFYDWPEYQQLALASWKLGQTRHGPPHAFPVRIDAPNHPITAGLAGFETADELWVKPGVQEGATVLASAFSLASHPEGSGDQEPVALAARFGQGRTFTLLLGHEVRFMENAGFQALLTRGTEWAASGFVTLPPPAPGAARDSAATTAAPPGRSWRQDAESVALLDRGRVVWQFNHGADQAKPCFHPIALPAGPVLTWFRPPDHRWHRALWFSWKFINGVNYWEEDAQTGIAAGRTQWSAPRIETRPDFSSTIEMDLAYQSGDAAPVLTEHRTIEVTAPQADGTYRLDWDCQFRAGGVEVLLDRTPLPEEPDGKPYGGYAGLSVRFAPEFADPRAVSTTGPITFTGGRYRGRATGLDYSGRVAQVEAGLAILDHPANLNAPSPWYVINDGPMRYFSPAVLCYQPHRLKAGESLRLRYRVVVHPGRWGQEPLAAELGRYAAPPR